jgi:N-terminal acetyltransferase B complex non-catalytic subunit
LDHSIQHTIFNIELARVEALQSSFAAKYGVQFFAELDPTIYPYDGMHLSTLTFLNRNNRLLIHRAPAR